MIVLLIGGVALFKIHKKIIFLLLSKLHIFFHSFYICLWDGLWIYKNDMCFVLYTVIKMGKKTSKVFWENNNNSNNDIEEKKNVILCDDINEKQKNKKKSQYDAMENSVLRK